MKSWLFCDQCKENPYSPPAGTEEEQRKAIDEHKRREHGSAPKKPGFTPYESKSTGGTTREEHKRRNTALPRRAAQRRKP